MQKDTEVWERESEAAAKQYRAAMSSGRGRLHEKMIEGACRAYRDRGRAYIIKVPEPFRVIAKNRGRGIATVQFTAHAQPDFVGCIAGGAAIAFEAKYTDTGKLHQKVVTPTQAAALAAIEARGGIAAVCAGIGDACFMIPWHVFAGMKTRYGRAFVTIADIAEYRVKYNGVIWFLDYADGRARLRGGSPCCDNGKE